MNIRTGNEKFQAKIVASAGRKVVVQLQSGEFSYLFTVERSTSGEWETMDDVEMRAYGNTWRHIPGDFIDQLGIDSSLMMADIDLAMYPHESEDDDL